MKDELKLVIPVEDLSEEELRSEHAELAAEVIQMDADLANTRNRFMRRDIRPDEYWDWRARTIETKNWHSRRMTLLKAELNNRVQAQMAEKRKETGNYHRLKAHNLRMAMERIEELLADDLLDDALALAKDALLKDRTT